MSEVVLAAEGLGKQVTTQGATLTLLSEASLSISRGEAVAIIGPSGSGKSTLLALLAGLDVPTSGEVHLLGRAIADSDEDGRAAARAGKVGFVFQSFHLMEGMTALENVQLPLAMAGVATAEEDARRLLTEVGLGERLDHFPNRLSGGEQQRVALARAFAVSPELLFADEPTGNLDPATGEKIIELLFRLRDEKNTTLLLVTHDEQLAARCDRRFRVDSGRLASVS